jgi:effector-binding domain-containing protein
VGDTVNLYRHRTCPRNAAVGAFCHFTNADPDNFVGAASSHADAADLDRRLARKDYAVKYDVVVEIARPEFLAAVRTTILLSDIPQAWRPALDRVWAFLKARGDLDPGHNLFLYHHPVHRHAAMNIDFGVQVARRFDREGGVQCIETPAGEVAQTVLAGPYDRLGDAHNAIHTWCAANNRKIGQASWEPMATGPRTRLCSKRRSSIC